MTSASTRSEPAPIANTLSPLRVFICALIRTSFLRSFISLTSVSVNFSVGDVLPVRLQLRPPGGLAHPFDRLRRHPHLPHDQVDRLATAAFGEMLRQLLGGRTCKRARLAVGRPMFSKEE